MTKRLVSVLLAVCLFFVMTPAVFAASVQASSITASGVIGQVTYPSLEAAFEAASEGDVVMLLDYDSSLTERVTVPEGVIFCIQDDKTLRLRENGQLIIDGKLLIQGSLSVNGTGLLDVRAGNAVNSGVLQFMTRDNMAGHILFEPGGRAVSNDNVSAFFTCARPSENGKTWDNVTYANSWVYDEGPILTGLSVSSGLFTPSFASDVYDYKITVENATESIWLIPSALPGYEITVGGKEVVSGSRSDDIKLNTGLNVIDIRVMKPDASQSMVYRLSVTRKEYAPVEFNVTVESVSHGKIEASVEKAKEGDQVMLTAKPDSGYMLSGIVAVSNGKTVDIVTTGENTFGFRMPKGSVTIDAEFVKKPVRFDDVQKGQWFYDMVIEAADAGWISGTGKGKFEPLANMRRGDFCIMMARIDNANLDSYHVSRFKDVPEGSYYMKAISYCADKGYVAGVGNGKFNPNATITREQMAKIISNAKGIKPDMNPSKKFNDDAKISDWARGYIYGCLNAKILVGDNAGNVNPLQPARRAEAAAMLVRAFG